MVTYHLLRLVYGGLYGFRIVGEQYVPKSGPAVVIVTDSQGLGAVLAQSVGLIGLLRPLMERGDVVNYMHEQLMASVFAGLKLPMRSYGLRPMGSGTLALSLLDGFRAIQGGGMAIIAAEGDMLWDGVSGSVKDGGAWLGLRTGAPVVMLVPTAGCYDIWPVWQARPKLTGRMQLTVGRPFRLTDHPLKQVTPVDLEMAKAEITKRITEARYGLEGLLGWQGKPLLRGRPVSVDVRVRLRKPVVGFQPLSVPSSKQGMAVILFECPVCGTSGSIRHRMRPFSSGVLRCAACGATWAARRFPGRDYRLTLISGPREIIGLDMSLSAWYAKVKAEFRPVALAPRPGLSLDAGEQLYLEAPAVKLISHEPIDLPGGEGRIAAPTTRTDEHLLPPANASLGCGHLLMTDQRLIWKSDRLDIAFDWSNVSVVHLLFRNAMAISYGATVYTFHLGNESAVKWVAHADVLLNGTDRSVPRKVSVSPY